MLLGHQEVVLTLTGRKTTPFVKLLTAKGTPLKRINIKAIDQWLIQNAYDEAVARNDDFNARIFLHQLQSNYISTSDKDAAEAYLFEFQPPVIPSILKSLS